MKPSIKNLHALAKSLGIDPYKPGLRRGRINELIATALANKETGVPHTTNADEYVSEYMMAHGIFGPTSSRSRKKNIGSSNDIFLEVLDSLDATKIINNVGGYKKRTRIPSPESPIHKDYTGRKFFKSNAWKQLRYLAIKVYGRTCMCCGSDDGLVHVDHIKPRSRYPQLELDIRNLQILCEACNVGKGAWDMKDWRTDIQRLQAEIVHSKKGAL